MKLLPAALAALLSSSLRQRRARADGEALAAMDERDLKDLGLGRGEAGYWLAQGLCPARVTAQRSQSEP
jgi:uncharacterized protein YjiS (DUF1127 family)